MIKLLRFTPHVAQPRIYSRYRFYSTDELSHLDKHFEDAVFDEAKTNTFPSHIMRSKVIALQHNTPNTTQSVSLHVVAFKQSGDIYLPVFTSSQKAEQYIAKSRQQINPKNMEINLTSMVSPFSSALSMIISGLKNKVPGVLVNPLQPKSIVWDPETVKHLFLPNHNINAIQITETQQAIRSAPAQNKRFFQFEEELKKFAEVEPYIHAIGISMLATQQGSCHHEILVLYHKETPQDYHKQITDKLLLIIKQLIHLAPDQSWGYKITPVESLDNMNAACVKLFVRDGM